LLGQLFGARRQARAKRRYMRLIPITTIQRVGPASNLNGDFTHGVTSVPHFGLGQQAVQFGKSGSCGGFKTTQTLCLSLVGDKTGFERGYRRFQPGHQDMLLSDLSCSFQVNSLQPVYKIAFQLSSTAARRLWPVGPPDAPRRAVDEASPAWPMGARDSAGLPQLLWLFNILRLF
jgi:hypothetical protein